MEILKFLVASVIVVIMLFLTSRYLEQSTKGSYGSVSTPSTGQPSPAEDQSR